MDDKLARTLILSARLQYGSDVQPMIKLAVDKMVMQALYISDSPEGNNTNEIEKTLLLADGTCAVSLGRLKSSLKRLIKVEKVIIAKDKSPRRFKLSSDSFASFEAIAQESIHRYERVIQRLYKHSEENTHSYSEPFLDCLRVIFTRLGDVFVRQIRGLDNDIKSHKVTLKKCIADVAAKHNIANLEEFTQGIYNFFMLSDPDFVEIKMNMAQNYYIAKTLGLDPEGKLLSKETFSGAEFYIDTNVIIHALEPTADHYRSFEALSRACSSMNIKMNITEETIYELDTVVKHNKTLLQHVANQIPDEIGKKVRGMFYEMYRRSVEEDSTIDIDTVFRAFESPSDKLRDTYGLHTVEDPWFKLARNHDDINTLKDLIIQESRVKWPRAKGKGAALHDALVIRWINLERKRTAKKIQFITLDTSLPGVSFLINEEETRTYAVSLTAILQWISPFIVNEDSKNELAGIFSDALIIQLLPQDRFFELRDFEMLADMHISISEMPVPDVEACLSYLKSKAKYLDPTIPEDREQIFSEISKFLADPGRKYKMDTEALRDKLDEANLEIDKLSTENRRQALVKRAWKRVIATSFVWIIIFCFAMYAAITWGEGKTQYSRFVNSWPIFIFLLGSYFPALALFLGPHLSKILGWVVLWYNWKRE
jgi:hypothetical protein